MKIIKNQAGFTLIELLIALVIFAVGILGLATMQMSSIQGNSKGNRITEASNAAVDRIEQIIAMPYDSDNNTIDDDGDGLVDAADDKERYIDVNGNGSAGLNDLPSNADIGPIASADGNYQIYWNVAENYPRNDVKTVKVFVAPSGGGKNIEMTIIKNNL